MRPDMAKVVTESPRRGHGGRNRKSRARISVKALNSEAQSEDGKGYEFDSGPRKFKMSRLGGSKFGAYDDYKEFTDKLNPLRKYLRKQAGRPWDDVYSELREHLDFRSVSGLHIWDHVKQEVELHCVAYGKAIWQRGRYGSGGPVSGLYVHPVSRLLCYEDERFTRYRKPKPDDVVVLEPSVSLHRFDGIWYRVRYGFKDVYHPPVRYGEGCGSSTGRIIREGYFTSEPVQQEKKQLNRAELKRHGLRNVNGLVAQPVRAIAS